MPNYATTYLSVKGDKSAVANVRKAFKAGEYGDFFDFEHFLPTPVALRYLVVPTKVVETEAEASEINEDYALYAPKPAEGGKVSRRAISAMEAQQLFDQYGALNWYDWNKTHWGTKWNSHDAELMLEEENHFVVRFDTAWTAPAAFIAYLGSLEGIDSAEYLTIHEKESGEPHEYSSDAFEVFDINRKKNGAMGRRVKLRKVA